MTLAFLAVVFGLALLVWSADRFVDGSAAVARHFGMPPLLIGMIIIGFGTSAPEMAVSAQSALRGTPGIALGNAYGSNITNIALILGLTALLSPLTVQSQILRKELPLLALVSLLAVCQLWDGEVSRFDAFVLLAVFAAFMHWTFKESKKRKKDTLKTEIAQEMKQEMKKPAMPLRRAVFWMAAGFVLLIGSSHVLVWGAIEIARGFGISDLIIGLTVIAVGTSLPELASSVAAVRKKEHDIALGNVLGSNIFNTLAVVGIAGMIRPMAVEPEILSRDIPVMGALTLLLFGFGYNFRKKRPGRLNRVEGSFLLACFVGYTSFLVYTAAGR